MAREQRSYVPPDAAVIRFSIRTPYWPLSMAYGVFGDASLRLTYASLDHYLGYHMLMRPEHRERVLLAPNGWTSHVNLLAILNESHAFDGDPVVSPTWREDREAVLAEGVRLKFAGSQFLVDLLMKTGAKRILDVSRDDPFYCHCNDSGANAHGRALMALRERVRNREPIGVSQS